MRNAIRDRPEAFIPFAIAILLMVTCFIAFACLTVGYFKAKCGSWVVTGESPGPQNGSGTAGPQAEVHCRACGALNGVTFHFCHRCGSAI